MEESNLMKRLTLDQLPKKVLAKLDLETVFKASRSVLVCRPGHNFAFSGRDIVTSCVGRRSE